MGKFRAYEPDQAWLLPPSVGEVLGSGHLSFFVHEIVERLDLRAIENSYGDEGQPGYHPRLLLKLWLYAYCLGITSSRRLEQRTREDLGFRYLAGGSTPDYWTLNAFRRRHSKALNDVFTQVLCPAGFLRRFLVALLLPLPDSPPTAGTGNWTRFPGN